MTETTELDREELEAEAVEPETEESAEKLSRSDKKAVKKLESELEAMKKDAEKAAKELEEANERYLRMLAEYDNYRKRTQKEKETIYTDAYSDALKQILPVIDTLGLAATQTGDAEAIRNGVEMTLKLATENFAKLGIEAFGEVGEEFDPNMHTAVFHVEDENLGENVIAEVLQKGYRKGDRIIRYAVCKVAN